MRILLFFLSFSLFTSCSQSDQEGSGDNDHSRTNKDSSQAAESKVDEEIRQPEDPAYVDSILTWVDSSRNACQEVKSQELNGEEWGICHFGDNLTSVEITLMKDGDLSGEHYLLKGEEVVYLSMFGEFEHDTDAPTVYAYERALKGDEEYLIESLGHGVTEEEMRVPVQERWDARAGDYEDLK